MRILFLVILLLLFAVCVLLGVLNFFNYQMLQKISEHLGLEPEVSAKKKAEAEAQRKKEESDEAFTNMLVELSEEKKAKDNAPFPRSDLQAVARRYPPPKLSLFFPFQAFVRTHKESDLLILV